MKQQISLRNKIIKAVFAILLFIILIFIMIYISSDKSSKSDGNITVIINNIDNKIVSKERISYESGDTLYEVVSKKYELICDEAVYGHYILGVKGNDFEIITKGDTSSWIWLELAYLNEDREYSDDINFNDYTVIDVNKGIDGIELKDNMIFAVNERDNEHPTSIFNQDISINNDSINNIFEVIVILFSILLVITLIIVFIYKSHKYSAKITTKELCILAFMTAILFVQEQLLSFIPNVQFTFMLISLYTIVFGFKRTSIIIFVHVLLDNLVMGSLNPIVMIPMLIGYELLSLLIYIVRNKSLFIITITSALGSILYCLCFLVVNSIFLDISFLAYFITDIPFEIILVISTIITMMYAYKPLEKILKSSYN